MRKHHKQNKLIALDKDRSRTDRGLTVAHTTGLLFVLIFIFLHQLSSGCNSNKSVVTIDPDLLNDMMSRLFVVSFTVLQVSGV